MKQFLLSFIAGIFWGGVAALSVHFLEPAPAPEASATPSSTSAPPRPPRPAALSGDEIFRSMAQLAAATGAMLESVDAPPTTQPVPPWQAQINSLIDELPPEESVKKIAALLPSLPPEAQEEAAWRIDSMIFEEDYEVAATILRNPGTTPQAWKVLFEGLQRRPDCIGWPLLADLASQAPAG